MRRGFSFVSSLTVLALLVASAWRPLAAQGRSAPARTVTQVAAKVNIGSYRGPCPARLVFTGTITTAAVPNGLITYRWVRSDKATSEKRTIRMTGTTATVSNKWTLGRSGEQERVWQKLEILSPNGIISDQADAVVLCN